MGGRFSRRPAAVASTPEAATKGSNSGVSPDGGANTDTGSAKLVMGSKLLFSDAVDNQNPLDMSGSATDDGGETDGVSSEDDGNDTGDLLHPRKPYASASTLLF